MLEFLSTLNGRVYSTIQNILESNKKNNNLAERRKRLPRFQRGMRVLPYTGRDTSKRR